MSYADVDGIRIYHDEHGSGKPLILLHGGLAACPAPSAGMARNRRAWPAVLPGHTRYDVFASADLPTAVIPFLDAPSLEPPDPFGR